MNTQANRVLRAVKAINAAIPDGYGFILVVAPYSADTATNPIRYVSTIRQEHTVILLRGLLLRAQAGTLHRHEKQENQ